MKVSTAARLVESPVTLSVAGWVLAACGGIAVEGTTWRAPEFEVGLMPLNRYSVGAGADATLHSARRWRSEALGGEAWLMAGSDARPTYWVTLLRFDLGLLGRGESMERAEIVLPLETGAESTGAPVGMAFAVHRVLGRWEEERVTWRNAPKVEREPMGGFEALQGASEDRIDVTEEVRALMLAGRTTLELAIVPERPERSERRSWASRESGLPGGTAPAGPRLELVRDGSVEEPVTAPTYSTDFDW